MNGTLEEQLALLKKVQWVAYAAILAVFLAIHYFPAKEKFFSVLIDDKNAMLSSLQIGIGVVIWLYILAWFLWTVHELQLCQNNVSWSPPVPIGVFFIILIGAAGLGVLAVLYDRIVPFALFFLVVDILSWRGTDIFDEGIGLALAKTRQLEEEALKTNGFKRERLEAIEEYYIQKPQEIRLVFRMVLTFIVIALAVLGHLPQVRSGGLSGLLVDFPSALNYAAYSLMLATVLVSEAVIYKWRIDRDWRVRRATIGEAFSTVT
jgi:hypothetical protein